MPLTQTGVQAGSGGWWYQASGTANVYDSTGIVANVSYEKSLDNKDGLDPSLVFRYIKRKFGILEKIVLDRRLAKLEKAFNEAVENGQELLGEKILGEVAREMRESQLYAKGIRHWISREDLFKHKHDIKGGHISDTRLGGYTRVIPKDVLAKKKAVEGLFDDFVVLHYFNEKLEQKREKKQKMTPPERSAMRDPILFGIVKDSDRWYFIADWEDELCDLTFDELVDVLGDNQLTKYPKLNLEEK